MDSAPRLRLFAGIALDNETRAACADVAERLRRSAYVARYQPPENYHITLAFLGYVLETQVTDVELAVFDAAKCSRPFGIALDKVGAFPAERRPRVVYVGSRDQGKDFRRIAGQLRDRCAALGFVFHDDAVAHVTLARVDASRPQPLPLLEVAPIELRVEAISLFESRRVGAATRYHLRTSAVLELQ